MADRRNLSIPINLAFLAGLMAASQLTTAMAPMQPYSARAEMKAANPVASPPPTVITAQRTAPEGWLDAARQALSILDHKRGEHHG